MKKDQNHPLGEWAERSLNVQLWMGLSDGGHCPAWEEPELLVQELRAFFHQFRDIGVGPELR